MEQRWKRFEKECAELEPEFMKCGIPLAIVKVRPKMSVEDVTKQIRSMTFALEKTSRVLEAFTVPPVIPPQPEGLDTFVNRVSAIRGAEIISRLSKLTKYRNFTKNLFPGNKCWGLLPQHTKRSLSDYFITAKADGTRYLVVVDEHRIYLVNRNAQIYVLKEFSSTTSSELSEKLSVLDVEVVATPLRRKKSVELLVFDCLAVRGKCVESLNLVDRLKYSQEIVSELSSKRFPSNQNSAITFNFKPHYPIEDLVKDIILWNRLLRSGEKKGYKVDGLVLTPKSEYVVFFLCWRERVGLCVREYQSNAGECSLECLRISKS